MEPPVTPHHYGQTGLKYGGKHLYGEKSLSITEDECVVVPVYTSELPAVEPVYPFCDDTVVAPPLGFIFIDSIIVNEGIPSDFDISKIDLIGKDIYVSLSDEDEDGQIAIINYATSLVRNVLSGTLGNNFPRTISFDGSFDAYETRHLGTLSYPEFYPKLGYLQFSIMLPPYTFYDGVPSTPPFSPGNARTITMVTDGDFGVLSVVDVATGNRYLAHLNLSVLTNVGAIASPQVGTMVMSGLPPNIPAATYFHGDEILFGEDGLHFTLIRSADNKAERWTRVPFAPTGVMNLTLPNIFFKGSVAGLGSIYGVDGGDIFKISQSTLQVTTQSTPIGEYYGDSPQGIALAFDKLFLLDANFPKIARFNATTLAFIDEQSVSQLDSVKGIVVDEALSLAFVIGYDATHTNVILCRYQIA